MLSPIFYILLLFIFLFILLEVRPLVKQRAIKELVVASLFFLLALSYGVDLAMNWMKLPNPRTIITVVKPVSQAFDEFFKVNQ